MLADLGRLDEALDRAVQGLRMARTINLATATIDALTTLAHHSRLVGDEEAAMRLADEAIEIASRAGTRFELTGALITQARCQLALGNLVMAGDLANRCLGYATGPARSCPDLATRGLRITERTGHRIGQAEALRILGMCTADLQEAARHEEAAEQIYREIGAPAPRGLVVSDSSA